MIKKNPFYNPTKEEIKKDEAERKAIELKNQKVVEDAQACLSSTVFAKYRESLKVAREGLIKLMKMNNEPDPVKFAFFCKACLVKIDAFDMMLEEVEKDSKGK